jgi:predicted RNA binding protein YcfA (HicA-like mRNA interferase family)
MRVDKMITGMGYKLIRSKRHLIYQHPCGAMLTVSKTASDHRAVRNIMADAKRLLRRYEAPV